MDCPTGRRIEPKSPGFGAQLHHHAPRRAVVVRGGIDDATPAAVLIGVELKGFNARLRCRISVSFTVAHCQGAHRAVGVTVSDPGWR